MGHQSCRDWSGQGDGFAPAEELQGDGQGGGLATGVKGNLYVMGMMDAGKEGNSCTSLVIIIL